MEAFEFDGVLNAHAYLRVERPPRPWTPDVELEAFVRLLGEMISAALTRNNHRISDITVNVSNVTVEREHTGPPPPGRFVALTLGSHGIWSPETTWSPATPSTSPLVTVDLEAAAAQAGAAYGYSRDLGNGSGSVTVLLPTSHGPTANH